MVTDFILYLLELEFHKLKRIMTHNLDHGDLEFETYFPWLSKHIECKSIHGMILDYLLPQKSQVSYYGKDILQVKDFVPLRGDMVKTCNGFTLRSNGDIICQIAGTYEIRCGIANDDFEKIGLLRNGENIGAKLTTIYLKRHDKLQFTYNGPFIMNFFWSLTQIY